MTLPFSQREMVAPSTDDGIWRASWTCVQPFASRASAMRRPTRCLYSDIWSASLSESASCVDSTLVGLTRLDMIR